MTTPRSKVYFYGTDNGRLVKIGWTSDPLPKRRKSLENEIKIAEFRGPLHLLACALGSLSDEKSVQAHFKATQFEGEWFHTSEELLDYLRWLRNQWFVITSEEQDFPGAVSSALWLPGNGRSLTLAEAGEPDLPFGTSEAWSCLPTPVHTGDDYYTSDVIMAAVQAVLGEIDLDPASHPVANRVVRARHIYTNADNGLARQWHGKVWLNPPFSQWHDWVKKVLAEWLSGRVTEMCVLAATRTLTAHYFAPIISFCSAMCILTGRIPFWGPKGSGSPDDGHAIFYFGPNVERFAGAFSSLGNVLYGRPPA